MRNPWPIENCFRMFSEAAPEALASRECLDGIGESLRWLPPGSSSYFLECRLGGDDAGIDFGACFRSPLDSVSDRPGRADWDGNGTWKPVADALSLWGSPASALRRRVPYMWIEMDGAGLRSRPGKPGFLFCVDPSLARVPERFRTGKADLLTVAREITGHLFPDGVSGIAERTLGDCLNALPADGRILHISAMPSRSPAAVKVNVRMPKKALLGFLRRIRWPGDPSDLERIWRAFDPFQTCAKIDLEIGDGFAPRLGLELHPYNAPKTGRTAALQRLERTGIAQGGKARALAAWTGSVTRVFPGHRWPTRMVKEFGLKLVLGEGHSVRAKGYLGFYPVFTLR
jgi:hypothetical protein